MRNAPDDAADARGKLGIGAFHHFKLIVDCQISAIEALSYHRPVSRARCSGYPSCTVARTAPLDEYLRMKRSCPP